MKDDDKTKDQIISELAEARHRITELEVSETLRDRIDEVLLKSESQYRSTLDSIGEIIHVIDTELQFLLFNTAFKQLNIELGFETDVIGKKITDMYPFLSDKIFEEYTQVFNTGKTLVTEERITIRGRKFITETRKIPIFEEGRVTKIVTVIRDITERKNAEENIKKMKEKYENLIKNIPDAIYSALADVTSTTTFVSERITDWTGYTPADFYENENLWAECIHPEDRQQAVEGFINAYRNKKEYIFEYRMVHKETGQIYHLSDHGVPIRDAEDQIIRFDGILTDISERKQAEEALLESEGKFKLISENIPVVVYSALPDEHSTSLFISGRVEELTGYTGKQFLADWTLWERVVHPDDIGYVWEAIETHRLKKEQLDVEYRIITKDNIIKWVRDRATPALDERNQLVRIDGYMEDITERKQAEDALRESEEKYRSLFQDSRDAVYINQKDNIVDANKAMLELFGYSREEMLRMLVTDVYANPEDRAKFLKEITLKGSVRDYEVKFRKKDGTEIDCLLTSSLKRDENGDIIGYQGVIRDITERKKLEQQLIESEEKYRTLVEKDPNMVFLIKDGKFVFFNQALLNTWGYSEQEIRNIDLESMPHIIPEHRQFVKDRYLKRLEGKQVPESYEFSILTKNGKIIPCLLNVASIEMEGTRVVQGVLTDISKIKELEEELKKSEERYRGLYESSIDGLVSAYIGGDIIECNQAFADMLGYTKEELFKLRLRDLIPDKWQILLDKIINEQLLKKGYTEEFEIEHIKKNSTIFPASVRVWLIKNKVDEPMGLWAIVRNITERRILEEELQKFEKLESIGILAGGIAHDFNNILTAILTNISVAKMASKSNEVVSKRLTEAEKASIRAKDLTQQLLTFSRGGTPIKKITSLFEILKDTVKFALSGTNVSSRFYLSDELWSVEVDEGQISQVIHNLVINADQAMPEGGIIEIHADNITVGSESGLPLNVGKYIKLTIRDHGIGIPKEYLSKIFDPYFTTKQKGSGLGLTVAYSIIKNHDGLITVESELGKGTVFYIYIPASKKQIHAKNDAERKPITGKGKILVMDDEEIIREALDAILTILGYQTDFAKNGEETIALFKEAKELEEPFDLVIMDLTIKGGMGGKEAIKRLIEIDPEVKAVVSSGYSTDPVMANFKKYGFHGVVAKPYDINELSKTLHKIIQRQDQYFLEN